MVTRTFAGGVLVVGQAAGVTVICAFVIAGSSVGAASRTAVRAAAGSFCSAMTRAPSRAAADSVPCTWNACPNSAMPSTRTSSSGTTIANSTAPAPCSSRSRVRTGPPPPLASSSPWCGAAQRPRGDGAAAPWRCEGLLGDRAAEAADDLPEELVEATAEGDHGGDDDDRDQADHEAVLDGGRALLLALEALLDERVEGDDGGQRVGHEVQHGGLPGGRCRPVRVGRPDVAALARGCRAGGRP